ncbi:MAG TPA: DUF6292 family protein [Actinophytocola sp.]|uniref:DUF6292 family protein n=1 Tax=Actinophytocola sp. TaxID=1872138 RepID=UPI002DDCFDA0|nr:DUF6292 family protein [Actinophytocola sp.]HEV2781614.1 DUF6292 family protein [Actinophytocola sp.]
MTWPAAHRHGEFARARAQAEADSMLLRARAVRTVTGQAVDAADLTRLLCMLGLDDGRAARTLSLERELARYVRAVAAAVGVPAEATGFEISDTVTAYLGLAQHCAQCPGRDLMLVWGDRVGWFVAVETDPGEPPFVVGYLGGDDVVPVPDTVARFVADVLDGRPARLRPAFPAIDGDDLAARLSRQITQ